MSIVFVNEYHNGDLFHCKSFIHDIMNQLPNEDFMFAHNLSPKVLSDLPIKQGRPSNSIGRETILKSGNDTIINTWIGAWFDRGLEHTNECTLRFNYSLYKEVYKALGLNLGPIEKYYPTIDFSKFDVSSADEFISNNKSKLRVLVSNGNCHSGQCDYNGDMKLFIVNLAVMFPDVTFIATQRFHKHNLENIKFTPDITRVEDNDLNEIAYLSKFCDVIVGRNSGPYCFATHAENIDDPSKTFFAFGERETDCFYHGLPVKSDYRFYKYMDNNTLQEHLVSLIKEKGELKNELE